MPRRLRLNVPGGFYHVTLRGNHRRRFSSRTTTATLLNVIVERALSNPMRASTPTAG